jgi:16S rRNA processing protein RimM
VLLVVGRIGRAHGVLGEATIEVRTDLPEERFEIGSVLVADPVERGPLTVKSARVHNGTLLLGFIGVSDRNDVEKLRDTVLLAEVDISEGAIDEDDFHVLQLIDCIVVTQTNERIGIVTDVIPLPGQDLLAVATDTGEVLIPFVREIVPTVDVLNKLITVIPPPGLLDDK